MCVGSRNLLEKNKKIVMKTMPKNCIDRSTNRTVMATKLTCTKNSLTVSSAKGLKYPGPEPVNMYHQMIAYAFKILI